MTKSKKEILNLASELMLNANMEEKKIIALAGVDEKSNLSTVCANLSVAFSNYSDKVLLIDSDFGGEALNPYFNGKGLAGFSDYVKDIPLGECVQDTEVQGLKYMPAGLNKNNAQKMFSSPVLNKKILALKEEYNFIIINLGSANSYLSSLFFARNSESLYLILKSGVSTKDLVKQAVSRFNKYKVNTKGLILSKA